MSKFLLKLKNEQPAAIPKPMFTKVHKVALFSWFGKVKALRYYFFTFVFIFLYKYKQIIKVFLWMFR